MNYVVKTTDLMYNINALGGIYMRFIKSQDLKIGMRLAKPIYSKQGVLLFDRDFKLTQQGINSVNNFGLLGVYILEPAEPLPPISEEDIAFESFQTMMVFQIEEELGKIRQTFRVHKMQSLASLIIKQYGHLDNKIYFYQNLRSRTDFVYKHSLNTAILCTMISHVMNIPLQEQLNTVYAALVHDIGKLDVYNMMGENMKVLPDKLWDAQFAAGALIEAAFLDGISIRRICYQAARVQREFEAGKMTPVKMVMGAKILMVANRFDEITAMQLDANNSDSEVRALREMMDNPEVYDPDVVQALTKVIHILAPGVSVILNSNEKALVLKENSRNILRPVLLSFRDNSIIDLSLSDYSDLVVVDVLKSLDNRCIIDSDTLKMAGY